MPIKFGENGSIRRLAKRVSKLEHAVQQLTKAVRYDVGRDATPLHPIHAFQTQLGELQVCSRRLQEASKGSGKLAPMVGWQLGTAYESLNAALGPIGELGTTDGIPLSAHPRFASVREELIRLGDDVGLVMKASGQQAEADMEHSPYYQIPRILREAVKRKDSRLAKDLRLTYLDEWVIEFTGLDWQNSKMVETVAKLFVLDHIPDQTWELRYRSTLPGRPYVLVMAIIDLPRPELLKVHGLPPAEYYIAAKLPTWRIAWKMSWYAQF